MSFVLAGIMVFGALAFLMAKFGAQFIKRLLGMDILADVLITLALCWLFAITGTISGMLTGIFVGLLVSVALYFGKKLLPHQKLVRLNGRFIWVDQKGEFFCQT